MYTVYTYICIRFEKQIPQWVMLEDIHILIFVSKYLFCFLHGGLKIMFKPNIVD